MGIGRTGLGGDVDNKLLILGIALVGILLAGLFVMREGGDEAVQGPDLRDAQIVDVGRFVLETSGTRILEEEYTVFFHPADGYMLLSQSALTIGDQTVTLAQQAQYDRDYLPYQYHLAADTPSGTQIVSAQLGVGGLTMEVRVGLARQAADIADTSNLVLLDNNVIGHYALLLAAIKANAVGAEFTAAIPQALLSLPGTVEGPERVGFRSGGQSYEGARYQVRLGDTSITMVEFDGRLAGIFNETQATAGYDVERFPAGLTLDAVEEEAVLPSSLEEREISFESDGLAFTGTLAVPLNEDSRLRPAALLIHGSGPVDRNGNAAGMQMDAYRQIAHSLAEVGIASFRFDKRGVGASEGVAALASRTDLVNDLKAALEALRQQPEIDPDRVVLIGHSEGAYLAPILAVDDPTIAGVVLLSGAARPLDEVTRWQIESILVAQGAADEQIGAALAQQDEYFAFVEESAGEWSDYSVEGLREELPWLTDAAAEQLLATPLSLSWLREHYVDDTAATLYLVTPPILAINGEKDLQVPAAEADEILRIAELGGNEDVTVMRLPDLNHLLRHHPEEPNLIFRHLDEPVDSRVLEAVNEWVVERVGY